MSLDTEAVKELVIEKLKGIYDPEIPVSIYELGLIYDVVVHEDGNVDVTMTLTTPNCPEAISLPPQVEFEVTEVEGVEACKVEVVWDPPWSPERMSEAAKLTLGF